MPRGVLELCQSMHEWASAEAAPLYRWAAPSLDRVEALRELEATMERLRFEHPEWFPDDMPDPRDRDAFERWLDEPEERRREFNGRLASQPLEPEAEGS